MARYCPNEFHDIDHFMQYLVPFMDMRSIQMEPGLLTLSDHLLEIDDLIINHYFTNQKMLDRFTNKPGLITFVLSPPIINECKWCGIDVPVNSIAALHPHPEHQVILPARWDSIGITIKLETVLQETLLSEHLLKQTAQPQKSIFMHESPRIKLFRNRLLYYFQNPDKLKVLINDQTATQRFRDWIFDELRMIFLDIEDYRFQSKTSGARIHRRYRTFNKAVAFIDENVNELFSISQLCDQIGTTPRTLQLCFKVLAGVTPLQYITACRLHAVQQELFLLKGSTKSISQIAQEYGLLHSGRFSSQYKNMYFELPNETLKRRKSSS